MNYAEEYCKSLKKYAPRLVYNHNNGHICIDCGTMEQARRILAYTQLEIGSITVDQLYNIDREIDEDVTKTEQAIKSGNARNRTPKFSPGDTVRILSADGKFTPLWAADKVWLVCNIEFYSSEKGQFYYKLLGLPMFYYNETSLELVSKCDDDIF